MESKVMLCRICYAESQHGIFIFSEEGRRLYLQAKIRKYLYITVSMEDTFSTIICENCCKKIASIHKFATMAVKTQDKFNHAMTANNLAMEPMKVENKGLLHTYLTKGIIDKQNEDTEEMEVRVDPMLFLQFNSSEHSEGEEEDDEDENISDSSSEKSTTKTKEIDKLNGKLYECTYCMKIFRSEITLQNHIWCHIPKNKRILNNQNNVKHEESDEKKSDDSANNNYDVETGENGNGMRFGCPICGKTISTKGNLKVHLETHRPKGKYGCDICGRIFKTQSNLYRHKDYHSGVQFTCNVCGRVYPTNSTLRAHSITHSDLRPHKCPLCDKTFKRNQDLKFHINQHTGARPYQCPYCPKAFASSGNCFSHRKRMHPLEVERDRERAAKIMR